MISNFLFRNVFIPVIAKGSWGPVITIFTEFLNATKTFLQGITIGVVVVMAIYYKIREITANPNEEAQFSSKTRNTLVACAFIFLVPTLATVLQSFFAQG